MLSVRVPLSDRGCHGRRCHGDDPAETVTPINDYDNPSRVPDLLRWLSDAGLCETRWIRFRRRRTAKSTRALPPLVPHGDTPSERYCGTVRNPTGTGIPSSFPTSGAWTNSRPNSLAEHRDGTWFRARTSALTESPTPGLRKRGRPIQRKGQWPRACNETLARITTAVSDHLGHHHPGAVRSLAVSVLRSNQMELLRARTGEVGQAPGYGAVASRGAAYGSIYRERSGCVVRSPPGMGVRFLVSLSQPC
jgi:hypothetical protein